jgi:hypothetical protein
MNVTTAVASSNLGGARGGSSTPAGHGVRGSSNIRGTAEIWLPGGTCGINESPAIKVIALLPRHRVTFINSGDSFLRIDTIEPHHMDEASGRIVAPRLTLL